MQAMRSVAGTLRLELAQYRELEAFAQFGSDLDDATQFQLRRGARLVEVLKQPQFEPLPIERQVLIVYAATSGRLDKIETQQVKDYERQLYVFFESEYKAVLDELKETGTLEGELKDKVDGALKTFGEKFAVDA